MLVSQTFRWTKIQLAGSQTQRASSYPPRQLNRQMDGLHDVILTDSTPHPRWIFCQKHPLESSPGPHGSPERKQKTGLTITSCIHYHNYSSIHHHEQRSILTNIDGWQFFSQPALIKLSQSVINVELQFILFWVFPHLTQAQKHAFTECDWFERGGGSIQLHLWAHMVQALLHSLGSIWSPNNHSCAGRGESWSWAKHTAHPPLPQTQPTGCHLHYRPDAACQRGVEEGEFTFFFFLFPFDKVPLCSPKGDLSPEVPADHRLYCL